MRPNLQPILKSEMIEPEMDPVIRESLLVRMIAEKKTRINFFSFIGDLSEREKLMIPESGSFRIGGFLAWRIKDGLEFRYHFPVAAKKRKP